MLWPRARRLAVLNQAGVAVTLPYLGELAGRWTQSGEGSASPLWREAHELSGHMLRAWPRQVGWYPGRTETRSDAATLLTLLSQQDAARIDTFSGHPRRWCLQQGRQRGDRAGRRSLAAGAGCGVARAPHRQPGRDELKRVRRPGPAGVAARVAGRAADLSRAAALVEALPGDPARTPRRDPWSRSLPVEPGFLVDLLTALGQIDAALADRAVDCILAWPQTYEPDAVLVPAVLGLTGPAAHQAAAAVQRLRTAALEHLRARIAEPLEPPRDWAGERYRVLVRALPRTQPLPGGSRPPALDV